MAFSVRPYQTTDASHLAEIFHVSVRELGVRDYTPEQVEAWSKAAPDAEHFNQIAADGRWCYVAVDELDRPIAYGNLERNGHIDHGYCHPKEAGKGAASAILSALEAEAQQAGLTSLHVEASEAARRLLIKRGYTVEARRDFELSGVAIHNFRMMKVLA